MVPAVPAPSAGAQSATPPAARDARPKPRAPFTEIRWEQDSPVAQIEGRWMAIRAIDGRPVAEILEWCRSRHGDRWQRRFEEDLDEVMTGMGQPLSDRVSLEVVDVETGATMTLTGVSMSEDNRRLLMQRKREREQRAAAAPDEVNRINRIHGAEIDARFAPLTQRLMAPGAELLTPAEAGADLDQLEWEIENAYAYATRLGVDYRAALDSIRWALDKGISRGDLALQIDQLMALFGDGHSRARLEEIPEGSLPVLLAGGPNGEIVALGAEGHGLLDPAHPMLVAIDDHPVELWRAAAQRLVTQGSPGLQRHEEVRWLGRIQLLRALMKRSARESVRITLASMAEATLGCHERARSGRVRAASAPLARARLRDALGYRPWTPSPGAPAMAQAAVGNGNRIALAALRLRRSSAGPLLRAITPGFVREALKARLR